MKIKMLINAVLIVIVMFSCKDKKQINTSSKLESSTIEVVEFSSQFSVPGIDSNLRGSYMYKVILNTDFKDSTQIQNLLVDSIKIPINSILMDGKRLDVSKRLIGKYNNLTIYAKRNIYHSTGRNPKNELKVISYELSHQNIPENEGALEYSSFTNLTAIKSIFPLGECKEKEHIYRP